MDIFPQNILKKTTTVFRTDKLYGLTGMIYIRILWGGGGGGGDLSKLVFYAQSTGTVISGQLGELKS